MRKVLVFNNVSLDGYFADEKGDMSWAHNQDPEWMEFTTENAKGQAEMLFGRITYDMMASWWPTPQAMQGMPGVARAMNEAPKVVFSRTLDKAPWQNTRLVKGDPVAEVRKMKAETGPGMLVMGSGTIVSQLTGAGLVDEYQLVLHPVVLGRGKTMFDVREKTPLALLKTRVFKNGNVVLWYERPR